MTSNVVAAVSAKPAMLALSLPAVAISQPLESTSPADRGPTALCTAACHFTPVCADHQRLNVYITRLEGMQNASVVVRKPVMP